MRVCICPKHYFNNAYLMSACTMINLALLIILNHGFIASDKLLCVLIIGNLLPEISTC
ncbi:hypothetical protein CIT292_10772 [Citrobacter youngae ATCC 29220]|uniref:Colicin immunity protein n=1 Tax=Citrobacter youngae ATCC 29220 TaxID=500640 RepID=D4BJD0_9ENTR|nr:hypothetical protein CIT292_10772 [Citrobacter youngae ATCC 29220]